MRGPQLWAKYKRADVPGLFGFDFKGMESQSGVVTRPGLILLFVTLDKSKMQKEHQFEDRFLSPSEFQWQSQNRTTRDSRAGRELVRDARTAGGLSQSELGARIGASRFWVAQFEKGKPSAELGLALKALQALGVTVRVEPRAPRETVDKRQTGRKRATNSSAIPAVDLGAIIAALTVAPKGKSANEWPSTDTRRRAAKGS